MKSFTYIVVVLTFLVATISYPHQHINKDTAIVTIDTTTVVDSVKMGKYSSVVDSMKMKSDSIGIARIDTTGRDTVRIRFIPGIGKLIREEDTASVFHRTQFIWSDAKDIGDLLWKLPGFFYRDLGEAGKWGQLNAFGVDGRNIDILLDGRPMNDPVTGTYNISDLPLEFIDHTEIFSGSASMLASSDAIGTSLNFVTRSYNSYRPMTKLRFVQDPKGTLLTDGVFTQNVARGLNLMIGFQRHVTEGRYMNADLDAWNVRTRLRYNISNRLNISLTDFYTKAGNGLNGGVDRTQSANIFDQTGAIVFNQYSWDKRSRHDLTLLTIARILSDSSSTTQASFYYSTLDREYRDPPDFLNGKFQNIDDSTKSSFWGIRLQQRLSLDPVYLAFGGHWERRQCDSTRTLASHLESEWSLFVRAELQLMNIFVPSLSLRSTSSNGESTVSTGIGIKSAVADWLTVQADASWYDRFPTFLEQYSRDSTIIRTNGILKEQHTFLQGGFDVHVGPNVQLSLIGFQRIVNHAIVFQSAATASGSPAISISNVNEVRILGINGQASLRWGKIEALGVMTLTRYKQADTLKVLIPDVILVGEICYHDKFFREKLDAKFGVRSRFYNRQQGMQFHPQTLSYVQYNTNLIGRSTTFDLFMILKIGEAHVSLSWENILNVGYLLSPIYPMPGRHIRFGVNWVFLD